jgi:hypothetical protein
VITGAYRRIPQHFDERANRPGFDHDLFHPGIPRGAAMRKVRRSDAPGVSFWPKTVETG